LNGGAIASVGALFALSLTACGHGTSDAATSGTTNRTATPIKHVIIIVGENRSFDYLFATYVPMHAGEGIHNLLSEEIVTAAGTPGPMFAKAHQYQITSAPNGGKFFISADLKNKTLYTYLPPPDVNTAPTVSPDVDL